jgi:hypothetical protein
MANNHLAVLKVDVGLDKVHRADESAGQPATAIAESVGYSYWSIACGCHAAL